VQEDALTFGLQDAIGDYHMGITAENVAERHQITREDMDALALTSHQRAAHAIAEGRFKEQILPIEIKTRKGVTVFDTDEHVRADTTHETLAARCGPPSRRTARSPPPMPAASTMARRPWCWRPAAKSKSAGLKPMARIVAWGHAGVEPEYMGEGPIKAVPVALQRAGLTLDMDVIEATRPSPRRPPPWPRNSASIRRRSTPTARAFRLGHPGRRDRRDPHHQGAYELQRTGGRYGLVTMCIGGGQGIAMVIENPVHDGA
jgi:acetyl-CoA C-acetyltransferase